MEVISLKLDPNMLKNIDSKLAKHNYSTRTEFVRDAIREKLEVLKGMSREEAIQKFLATAGKGRPTTDEERRQAKDYAWNKLMAEKGWNIK